MNVINPTFIRDSTNSDIFPQPLPGEIFLIRREGVECELRSSSYGKLSGTGVVFLTNQRMVFHSKASNSRSNFMGFQVRLQEMESLKFHQPVFGSNYLEGLSCSENFRDPWKIWFKSGGCGTFLPALSNSIQLCSTSYQTFNNSVQVIPAFDAKVIAYIDPNDPSVVYTQQPKLVTGRSLAE